jgi:hypothetical protein
MQTRISIHGVRGVNISWSLIIVSTIIAYGLYWPGWHFNERIVSGLFNYGYPASLIIAVLIYGYYHDQYISENYIFVETYGYFHWRKRICVNIANIDIMYIISETTTDSNDETTKNGDKYVRFKLNDGSLSDGFTLCSQGKMITEIQNINKRVTVVFTNTDLING